MLDLRYIGLPHSIMVIVVSLCFATLDSASGSDRHEGCFSQSNPMTHEEAKCRVMVSLERSYGLEFRHILEVESDLVHGEINRAIDKLTEDWAECRVVAMVDFAATRQDIPLNLLLISLTGEEMSEDDFLWLRAQLKTGALWDVIKHCEDEIRDGLMKYVSEP